MKFYLTIILIFYSIATLNSQEIVVSEYFNANNPNNEWTELIVTDDNISIHGYKLRDNSDRYFQGNQWQGGIEFLNIPLWKNLRRGTVIVINHRGNRAVDVDPSDGYLEIDAENTQYLRKYSWRSSSLSIQDAGDIVQIIDRTNRHVHALAHVNRQEGDFHNLGGSKIAYFGTCAQGLSVGVANTEVLGGYNLNKDGNIGYDTGRSVTGLHSGTKGIANIFSKDNITLEVNYKFWQRIREPDYPNQDNLANPVNFRMGQIDDKLIFTWNKTINFNVNNDYGGYIIIKGRNTEACKAIDGNIYEIDESVCGIQRIAYDSKTSNISIYEDDEIICGTPIRYTIYAYRFNNGDSETWDIKTGRGRAYTEIADFQILDLEEPDEFEIFSTLGTKFCEMDTTILYTNIPESERGKYQYAWYKELDGSDAIIVDFAEYGKNDTLAVYQRGLYRLEIRNEDGCILGSENKLFIEIIDKPEAVIANRDGVQYTSDTTIYLCGDEEYYLRADLFDVSPQMITRLFRDEQQYYPLASEIRVPGPGKYFYIFELQQLCRDTSFVVEFLNRNENIVANTSTIDFTIGFNTTSLEKTFILKNNDNEDYIFNETDISVPFGYRIINDFPLIIPANGELEIIVLFEPPIPGNYNGEIVLTTICKNNIIVELVGKQFEGEVVVVPSFLKHNFGPVIRCLGEVSKNLVLYNFGTDTVRLGEYSINNSGEIGLFPDSEGIIIAPGDSVEFTLNFNGKNDGQKSGEIVITWLYNGREDQLTIEIEGIVGVPEFEISPDFINFGTLSECEQFIDTTVTVTNTSIFPIQFDEIKRTNFETIGLEGSLERGEIKHITVRFHPKSVGNFSDKVNFFGLPVCTVPSFLDYEGSKDGSSYLIEFGSENPNNTSDTIDFGNVIVCQIGNEVLTADFHLKFNGSDEITARLLDIIYSSNAISSNLQINDILNSEKREFKLSFTPNKVGENIESIRLKFSPCDIEKNIYIKVNLIKPRIEDLTLVDFGTIIQGDISNSTLTITNPLDIDLTIKNIIIEEPFSLVGPNPPFVLLANSQIVLQLNFSSTLVSEFKDKIQILLEECDESFIGELKGTIEERILPTYTVELNFDEDLSVEPKEKFFINMYFHTLDTLIQHIDWYEIEFSLFYNQNAIYYTGNYESISKTDLLINYIDEGELSIKISSSDNSKITIEDLLLQLEFMAFDYNPGIYQIKAGLFSTNSYPKTIINNDDEQLCELLENCGNIGQKIVFNQDFSASYLSLRNDILSVNIDSDDFYDLSIYDLSGRKLISFIHSNYNRGNKEFNLRNLALSKGIYIIYLFSDVHKETIKYLKIE